MSTLKGDLQLNLSKIAKWMICLPCMVLWPFLSALPAFSLFSPDLNTSVIVFNIILLATGFWPLVLGFIAYKSLLTNEGRQREKIPSGESGLRVGYYATAWTAIYLFLAISRLA